MFPDPHIKMDTLFQKIISSNTDSSRLVLSVLPGKNYPTTESIRLGYDELTVGYLNSFPNPALLSKKEQVVNGMISRRINLTYISPQGKIHMTTVFVFAHGSHYAFQAASLFGDASSRDVDKVINSVRFSK
jgi:hypothetical protein